MTRWITLVAIVALVFGAGVVQADTWGTLTPPAWAPTPFVLDGTDEPTTGRDISPGLWWQMDSTYHYFRMELEASPSSPGNFASIYGIYLDDLAGGPLGTDIDYVPAVYDGVDIILDGHFSDQSGSGDTDMSLDIAHLHIWNPGTDDYDVTNLAATEYYFDFDKSGADTGTLDWRVAKTNFDDDSFLVCGSAHTNVGISFDTTECRRTPEPTTMALM
ncbi:MAG: hypothetical protein GF393_07100, partial [Armatimonadia bacterium]|nr:hypothetical protein [Armatimonadia bacterium]